jgi:endonuclease/exonuclease/phosphatase (EEP) superfamily protein YafD
MHFKSEIRGVLTGLGLVAVGVLAAISGPNIIPGQELLHSLRFHIAIGALALPVLLFIFGGRWRALLLAAPICVSLGQGAMIVIGQLNSRAAMAAEVPAAQFNLLSFNVLTGNPRGPEIVTYMLDTLPDVAVIMETPGIEDEIGRLATAFPYHAGCSGPMDCDLSLFSRTPLRDVQVLKSISLQRERLIVAKTTIDGQDVTLVAVHLSKPYFDENAWAELQQVRWVLQDIKGPVVLSGDFNAAAWSRNVADFVADTGLVPPPRYPATWPVRLGPFGVPIDNMFSRDGAFIQSISATESSIGSNHRGLTAQIGIMAPPAPVSPAP